MSVLSGMSTAISGLEANSQNLAVVSDNIVNSNTTGFKSSRGEFQSILAQDMGPVSGGNSIGRGTKLAGVTTLFSQGPISKSDRPTDLAVSGDGFFVLKGNRGMTFTRDGSFRFDKEGWLTNLDGNRIQAYEATPDGTVTGKLTDVRIPFNTIPARSTQNLQLHVNLDARLPTTPPLDLLDPERTAQFTTGVQVFDSVGNARALGLYFNRVDESNWEWYAMTDGANLVGGVPGTRQPVATGTLIFDAEGKLQTTEQTIIDTSFTGSIPDQEIFFDFGDSMDLGGTGMKGTTQFGSKNVTFRNVQDGWGAGTLADINIDAEGTVTGVYSNGISKVLAQLALARFEATERLTKIGNNQYRESIESGIPLIGKPSTAGRGTLMSRSLEGSNVDLAKEFVEMIKSQRGFQASAKSITSANEMLDEVINLIRF